MSDDKVFSGSEQTQVTPEAPFASGSLPDPLKELVGEGKKYASVEKALEALPHAQKHISTLEEETKLLRQQLEELKQAKVAQEELLQYIKENQQATNGKVEETASRPSLDVSDISKLVQQELSKAEQQKIAQANAAKVREALVAKFGDKAQEMWEGKAKELGIGTDFLNEAAIRSPKAVLAYFNISDKPSTPAPSKGSVNTAGFAGVPDNTPKRSIFTYSDTRSLVDAWRAAKPSE